MGGGCCAWADSAVGADQWLRGKPFRDDSFTEAQWRRHLTWRRYIPEPKILAVVVLSLAPVWGWSVLVALGVGCYVTWAEPAGAPRISGHDQALILPFQLSSFALSLLLLFKTNSSYGRWWEARTLWGSGYIETRTFLRLCISFVGRRHPELLPPLHRWTAAVLPALASYLRQQEHYMDAHLAVVLAPGELAWLRGRDAPPIAALQVLSSLLDQAGGLTDIQRQQLEGQLSLLDRVVGGSERILRQPMPYAYNRHTQRFLLLYFTFLPVILFDYFQWAALIVTGLLAFLLTGVENVGVMIEEPHRVLPLNQICAGTLRALQGMMDNASAAADLAVAAPSTHPPDLGAPRVVVVPLGGARDGTKPPAVLTARRHSGGNGRGVADGAESWARGAAGMAAAAVELSGPSGALTPSTARPTSPEPPDSFAGGLL